MPGLPAIAPVGPFALQAAGDAGHDPGDGGGHVVRVLQEEDLDLLSDETQGVREVAAHGRSEGGIVFGGFGFDGVDILVTAVGEDPGEGDQDEVGVELLPDAAFGLAVKGLQQALAGLVEFLDGPAFAIQVGERGDAVAGVGQRGDEAISGSAFRVFDEAQWERWGVSRERFGRLEGDTGIGLGSRKEGVHVGAGIPLEAEDTVHLAVQMGFGQREGIVAAVIDDHVAFGDGVQMGPGGRAFVVMIKESEVDRNPAAQAVEDTDEALRVMRVGIGGPIPVFDQRAWQGVLGAIDGEDPVSLPERIGGTVRADVVVQSLEHPRVQFLPGRTDRGGGRRFVLWKGDRMHLALLPQRAERGLVPLFRGRGRDPQDKENEQEAAEDPAPFLPASILPPDPPRPPPRWPPSSTPPAAG